MAKRPIHEFEIDDYKVNKVIKWLEKGAKMTEECKRKEYTYIGRVRKKREIVATNVIGAIRVGQAKSTNHREVRIKNQRYEGFWPSVNHFVTAYRRRFNSYPTDDNFKYGRQYVIDRARKL